MDTRKIRKIAVLGSGVMGSRIACHFANIGLDVLLLDLKNFPHSKESEAGTDAKVAQAALLSSLKSNPSPIYSKDFAKRIKTGNLVTNLH
jgi:3-hydroxyacyl-CoA dehydrogenase